MATSEKSGAGHDDICDVPGVLVGHDTDLDAATGCTVLRFVRSALGAVDVRGGAPATRETDLLDPLCMMDQVHALVLTGGSAFGLDAASGVARTLESEGVGFETGVARVPIVPAAALFDLGFGRADIRPDAVFGERALRAARGDAIQQGTVGAGTGATVGKLAGPAFMMKGGLGSASARTPDGLVVGALVAVNAVGDVYDPATGEIVAGARSPMGIGWLASDAAASDIGESPSPVPFPGAHTTLAAIATDAPFSKAGLAKIAQMAHDGLARAIRPVHTPFDGDVVFAISTAPRPASTLEGDSRQIALVGALAADTLALAVLKAVRLATGLHGVPAVRDL